MVLLSAVATNVHTIVTRQRSTRVPALSEPDQAYNADIVEAFGNSSCQIGRYVDDQQRNWTNTAWRVAKVIVWAEIACLCLTLLLAIAITGQFCLARQQRIRRRSLSGNSCANRPAHVRQDVTDCIAKDSRKSRGLWSTCQTSHAARPPTSPLELHPIDKDSYTVTLVEELKNIRFCMNESISDGRDASEGSGPKI